MSYPFEGNWTLIPELSHCDEGAPPASGHYSISVEGKELTLLIDWEDADGTPHHVEFTGIADGAIRDAGEVGMKASFHIQDDCQLISRAYNSGLEVSYAHRRASRDGAILNVLQFHNRPDGTRSMRLQTYRRDDT